MIESIMHLEVDGEEAGDDIDGEVKDDELSQNKILHDFTYLAYPCHHQ